MEYLNAGNPAILDIVQTKVGLEADFTARQQSLHDNFLANLLNEAINWRFPGTVGTDNDPRSDAALLFISRPEYNGNFSSSKGKIEQLNLTKAWDYGEEIFRNDYVTSTYGNVDPLGQNGNKLWFGGGNSIDDFNIVRHEGAGIEVALKAKIRGGIDYEPEEQDGIVVYSVDAGAGADAIWGTPAYWSFDYSIVAGLNDSEIDLKDIDFILSIDVNPTELVDMLVFTLINKEDNPYWDAGNEITLGDDSETMPSLNIEQNSFNIGFKDLNDAISAKAPDYNFGPGQFDIEITATHGGVELLTNAIRVNVGDF